MENAQALFIQVKDALFSFGQTFWSAATEPLKHLRIETGVLVVLFVLLGWLMARLVRSTTWRFTSPTVRNLQIVRTSHTNAGTVAPSCEEYIRTFADNPEVFLLNNTAKAERRRWITEKHRKIQNQYFVITLVECAPDAPPWSGVPVMTRELKFWPKTAPPDEGFLQLDSAALREVRDHNTSSTDDIDGTAIEGRYDLYVRKVSWLDIRHWLVHPNREIRIAVWVTIISMIVPVVFDSLFG